MGFGNLNSQITSALIFGLIQFMMLFLGGRSTAAAVSQEKARCDGSMEYFIRELSSDECETRDLQIYPLPREFSPGHPKPQYNCLHATKS